VLSAHGVAASGPIRGLPGLLRVLSRFHWSLTIA